MPSVTLNGLGTVELDRIGRIIGVGIPSCLEFMAINDMPAVRRKEVMRRVRIKRHVSPRDGHSYFRGCIDGHDCTGRNLCSLLRAYNNGVESIDDTDDPVGMARYASTVLAGDKGIPNHIESNNGRDYDVVTDNGKRFRFCRI